MPIDEMETFQSLWEKCLHRSRVGIRSSEMLRLRVKKLESLLRLNRIFSPFRPGKHVHVPPHPSKGVRHPRFHFFHFPRQTSPSHFRILFGKIPLRSTQLAWTLPREAEIPTSSTKESKHRTSNVEPIVAVSGGDHNLRASETFSPGRATLWEINENSDDVRPSEKCSSRSPCRGVSLSLNRHRF